jgi:hypothetical protein
VAEKKPQRPPPATAYGRFKAGQALKHRKSAKISNVAGHLNMVASVVSNLSGNPILAASNQLLASQAYSDAEKSKKKAQAARSKGWAIDDQIKRSRQHFEKHSSMVHPAGGREHEARRHEHLAGWWRTSKLGNRHWVHASA